MPPKKELIVYTQLMRHAEGPVQEHPQARHGRPLPVVVAAALTPTSRGCSTVVMQLRKCCNHPYLFEGVEDKSLDPAATTS